MRGQRHASADKSSLHSMQLEKKPTQSTEDPAQPEIKIIKEGKNTEAFRGHFICNPPDTGQGGTGGYNQSGLQNPLGRCQSL